MDSGPNEATSAMDETQKFLFDLQGYIVLKGHYDEQAVAELHAGIDELQAIPIDYETYGNLGVASYYLAAAMKFCVCGTCPTDWR